MYNKRFKSSKVLYLCVFLPLFLFTFLFPFSSVSAQFFGGNSDFLEQVFSPSKSQQQVINLWNDKTAVGREVLNPSMNVDIELWQNPDIDVSTREPLLVRFTKFLLRLTIVLSVTMIIYTGIRYILAAW